MLIAILIIVALILAIGVLFLLGVIYGVADDKKNAVKYLKSVDITLLQAELERRGKDNLKKS